MEVYKHDFKSAGSKKVLNFVKRLLNFPVL